MTFDGLRRWSFVLALIAIGSIVLATGLTARSLSGGTAGILSIIALVLLAGTGASTGLLVRRLAVRGRAQDRRLGAAMAKIRQGEARQRALTRKLRDRQRSVRNLRERDFDLVILDLVMPGMGGGEAFDRLRELRPDLRVLLSSGYGSDGEARMILERGADGFIQKPFDLSGLSGRIKEVLEATSVGAR